MNWANTFLQMFKLTK
uniref:Uncharacterized protein n=1 Tax=Rhizophora mucronata TaxID=61149 RepID=A0A2P2P9L5_RHIMU